MRRLRLWPAFLFPLTTIEKNPIYLAKQQEELLLIIEGRLTRVFPELVPLFERWSVGNTDRAQVGPLVAAIQAIKMSTGFKIG